MLETVFLGNKLLRLWRVLFAFLLIRNGRMSCVENKFSTLAKQYYAVAALLGIVAFFIDLPMTGFPLMLILYPFLYDGNNSFLVGSRKCFLWRNYMTEKYTGL